MSDWNLIRDREEWRRHVQWACREMAEDGDEVDMDEPEDFPVLVRPDVTHMGGYQRIGWALVSIDDAARLLDATVPEGPATEYAAGTLDLLQRMVVGNDDRAQEVRVGDRIYGMDGLNLVVEEPGRRQRKTGISLRPFARLCYADADERARRLELGGLRAADSQGDRSDRAQG